MKKLSTLIILLAVFSLHADNLPLSTFSLKNYDQHIMDWHFTNNHPLLSPAQERSEFINYKSHYNGILSPWSAAFIYNEIHPQAGSTIYENEIQLLSAYNNIDRQKAGDLRHIGYGENFHSYTGNWLNNIKANIPLQTLGALQYKLTQRAIATTNLEARVLPTTDPDYYHYSYVGEGYPFDNLQMSSLWVGTPLYVFAESKDHIWALVSTPAFIAWVKTTGIAYVSPQFIRDWNSDVRKGLNAIVKTKTGVFFKGDLIATAYVGTVLPSYRASSHAYDFPVRNPRTGQARIIRVTLSQKTITLPYQATQKHIANIMKTLINRPYGWGGMYFYSDCSQELKDLFTPFAIWLPRHSSAQVIPITQDLSDISGDKILSYLKSNIFTPFMSIVYIGGHVILLLGNHANPLHHDV